MQVGNGGATGNLGSGNNVVINSALVALRTGTLTMSNTISGSGAITNNGTGTLVLSGNNTYTGSTTISTGIVQVVSSTGLGGRPAAFDPAHINIGIGELEASTNFSLSDTNSGVTVAAGTIGVDSGMTLTISNPVVVTTSLTKSLPGTLILQGSNDLTTFTPVLNVDTASATASDGALRIASQNAFGGVQTINIRNNQIPGSSTLQLDGTTGGLTVNAPTFNWSGRNNLVPAIENIAGDNVWNPSTVTFVAGGTYYGFQCDAGNLILAASFPTTAPATVRNILFAGAGSIIVSNVGGIQGASSIINVVKTNTGTLLFQGASGYTGLTSIQGGTLIAADGSSFGNATINATNGNIEIAPYTGQTAMLIVSNAVINAQRVIIGGVTGNTGTPGTGTLNQYSGDIESYQWFTVGSGGTTGGTGTFNMTGGTLNMHTEQMEVANFPGTTGTVNLSGSAVIGIWNGNFLSMGANANAGNGTFNQNGGTVTFYSDGGGTVGGNGSLYLGRATGLTSNYVYNLNSGTLTVPTVTSASGNSQFYFNGGTLKAARTNTAFVSGLTAANVSAGGAFIDDGTFSATIPQPLIHDPAVGGVDGGLTKLDSGTLILAGTNTYTGGTTNTGGTLLINGSTATGAVVVTGGTLGGSGVINGAVDVQSGSTLAPGSAIGILNVANNVTFESGSIAQFNFGTGTNSKVVVTGAVNVNSPTTIAINFISANAAVGTYNLIQYGSLAGFANLTPPTSPNPRFTFSLVNNTGAKTVQLVVSGVPASLVWHGDGSFNGWDNSGGYQNWFKGGSPDFIYDGDSATFNDHGSNTPSINLTATLSPSAVVVNSTINYDFAGSGAIAGPGSLVKFGPGTLTLEDTNSYVGGTVISNGTVHFGAGNANGSLGTVVVTNNASLVFDRSDAITLPTPIYGSGSVTSIGSGTVTASGSNYYTGNTTINAGITFLANASGLGATNGTISVDQGLTGDGAELYITANVDNGGNPLVLFGTGGGTGALRKGAAGVTTYNGAVSLAGDTSIAVDGGATLNLASPTGLNGSAVNANLTLLGPGAGNVSGPLALGSGGLTVTTGTWTLAPSNSYTGPDRP